MDYTRAIIAVLLLSCLSASGFTNLGGGVFQSSGTRADTQAAIDAASTGNTILLPPGSFQWTTGVSTGGKALKIQGAGAGTLQGDSTSSVKLGAGLKTFTTQSGLTFAAGQAITANFTQGGFDYRGECYMTGTVSSYSGTTLQINVTTFGGPGTDSLGHPHPDTLACWTFTTPPTTTIVNDCSSGPALLLFRANTVTELSGIYFDCGYANAITNATSHLMIDGTGSSTVLVHDCRFSINGVIGVALRLVTNGCVIYKCGFDARFWSGGGTGFGIDGEALETRPFTLSNSWTTADTMGTRDTTGMVNTYIEDCYFVGFYVQCTNFDDNSRVVARHNVFNHSATASHGRDTSADGLRHCEVYDNRFVYTAGAGPLGALDYNVTNGWFYGRGGTGVFTDNIMPDIQSSAWGDKKEIIFIVQALRRTVGGSWSCWNAGYPFPHQVGWGHNGTTAISDPVYIWNNTGTQVVLPVDYDGPGMCVPLGPSVTEYIQAGRDYFLNAGAKPGWTKYPYPHFLRADAGPAVPVIISPDIAMGTSGQLFSHQIVATNSPLSYDWNHDIDVPWLSLSTASGFFTGTPPAGQTHAVLASATNAVGTGSQWLTLIIYQPGGASITSPLTATGTRGVAFPPYTITATGSATITFNATNLPAGLSFSSPTITGTPSVVGITSNTTISAMNALGTDSKVLSVNVLPSNPIVSLQLEEGVGSALADSSGNGYNAVAVGTPQWVIGRVGTAGLQMSPSTLLNLGTIPALDGKSAFSATLWMSPSAETAEVLHNQNGAGLDGVEIYLTPTRLGLSVRNTADGYIYADTAVAPFVNNWHHFGMVYNGLGAGNFGKLKLYIDGVEVALSYTGNVPSSITPNVSPIYIGGFASSPVTGGFTGGVDAIQLYNIALSSAQVVGIYNQTIPPPVITSSSVAFGTANQAFTYSITADQSPVTFGATGLPTGLTVTSSSGVISGTPVAVGTSSITMSATNTSNLTGFGPLSLVVASGSSGIPQITSGNVARGTVGQAFGYTITATNSPTLYKVVSIADGTETLPPGLALGSASGAITGTPSAVFSMFLRTQAINASGTGSKSVSFQIADVLSPVITSPLQVNGFQSAPFSYQITATNSPTSFSSTQLPFGLSLGTASGLIDGVPLSATTSISTLSATNAFGTGTAAVTFVIRPIPSQTLIFQTGTNGLLRLMMQTGTDGKLSAPTITKP